MIIIDGIQYDIPIVDMKAQADMLDKYAERTNDGVLHRELIGVYDNYEIEFAHSVSRGEVYADLWWKLTEPVPWHNVVFPTVLGERTIEGYFANTNHQILRMKNGTSYWKGLTTSFVSREKRP
jgi:hypothetical protein